MPNFHNYILYIRNSRSFNLIIDGLSQVASWILNVRLRLRMDVSFSAFSKIIDTIKLYRIRIVISSTALKLTQILTNTIKLYRVRITGVMKQTMKFIHTIKLYKVNIIANMIQRMYIRSIAISIRKIAFSSISIIVAQFNKLSTYDPQMLSSMDSETLQALDYTA